MKTEGTLHIVRRWWPFVVLCLASAARVGLAENFSQVMPTTSSLGAASGLLCIVCVVVLLTRREALPDKSAVGKPLLAGALLLCGPELALLLRADDLAGSDLLLASTLIPVVIAVVMAARGDSAGISPSALWPGLAASAALLLLFPEPRIHFVGKAIVMILLPVLTGIGAVLLFESSVYANGWWAAFSSGGASLVFFTSFALSQRRNEFSPLAFAFDLMATACTLLSVRRIGEVRYSSIFVLLPLVLSLYGLVLLRPPLSTRSVLGLAMLLAGAVVLLRHKAADDSSLRLHLLE